MKGLRAKGKDSFFYVQVETNYQKVFTKIGVVASNLLLQANERGQNFLVECLNVTALHKLF